MGHVPGGEELAFLDVDGAAGSGGGDDQVCLAAEKGGDLQYVGHFGDRGAVFALVHVGEDGETEGAAYVSEDLQGGLHADAAGACGRGAVGFVVAAFEDQADAEAAGDLAECGGAFHGVRGALDLAGAGDEREGQVVGEADAADRHARVGRRVRQGYFPSCGGYGLACRA